MGQVDHDQANLLLKLYDLRREPRLREARAWFGAEFNASSVEEMSKKYPQSSKENANVRMVGSYWNMACALVNRGLIDDELFFETSAEFWFVWEKLRPLIPGMRAMFHNPSAYKALEDTSTRLEKHWEKVSPGMVEFHRQRIAQMSEAAKAASKKS